DVLEFQHAVCPWLLRNVQCSRLLSTCRVEDLTQRLNPPHGEATPTSGVTAAKVSFSPSWNRRQPPTWWLRARAAALAAADSLSTLARLVSAFPIGCTSALSPIS